MIKVGDHKGFTLIELIIFIIIGGIFLPVSMIAFTAAMQSATQPDYYVKARFYAEQKMEELTSQSYDNLKLQVTNPETSYAAISGSNGFQWKWRIKYINPNAFAELDNSTMPIPNYTTIKVFVLAPDSSVYDVSTIVTKRPKAP